MNVAFSLTVVASSSACPAPGAASASTLPLWAQWITAMAPVATAIAVIVAFLAYRQKKLSDDRADWWARAVKAIDLMTAKDDMVAVNAGMALAGRLADSENVTQEDKDLFADVTGTIVDTITETIENENVRAVREQKVRAEARRRAGMPWRSRRNSGD